MAKETKQHVLNDITDILGMSRWTIKRPGVNPGSSLPKHVFEEAARQTRITYLSMPDAAEKIVTKAGLPYLPTYDSRESPSAGGSTVTLAGAQALRAALTTLLRSTPVQRGLLLTWNPEVWKWPAHELAQAIDATASGQVVEDRWSTGRRSTDVEVGERVFLLRQGSAGGGIMAAGSARSRVYQAPHHSTPGKVGNYIDLTWDIVLDPSEALPIETLREHVPTSHNWAPQESGTRITPTALDQLEELWLQHLGTLHTAAKKGEPIISGQARQRDSARRRAVEEAAQDWAMKAFKDAGWAVEDTHIGNPFDARASRGTQTLYIEAKGTQSDGGSVIVTKNEVLHALKHPGDCVIAVWSGMRFRENGSIDKNSGQKIMRYWHPDEADLAPLTFNWTVSGVPMQP